VQAQNATLERFKNGQLNCLVSTSVAEEGLDLKACQLVARHSMASNCIHRIADIIIACACHVHAMCQDCQHADE
jgi:Helicase conserved C-terminal domain